jgi:hypothetical protein
MRQSPANKNVNTEAEEFYTVENRLEETTGDELEDFFLCVLQHNNLKSE